MMAETPNPPPAERGAILRIALEPMEQPALERLFESMQNAAITVPAPALLPVGSACGLEIITRDGRFVIGAEAVVTAAEAGPEGAMLRVRATRFGRLRQVPPGPGDQPPRDAEGSAGAASDELATLALAPDLSRSLIAQTRPDEKVQSLFRRLFGSAPRLGSLPGGAGLLPRLDPFDVLGSYQVLKHLGGGGMAEVYLARATLSAGVDKLVALKTGLPEHGATSRYGVMFLQEARVSATLQHPNLVQVFDFGEAAGRPFLVMEYIHGRDLVAVQKRLSADIRPPSPSFAVGIAIALAKALEYLHDKKDLDGKPLGLVHRDISPGNVLVTSRGEIKLMDLGVVASSDSPLDSSELLVGKLPYMTPEQARGETPSPSWDLYAVGAILYELLTQKRPQTAAPQDYLELPVLRVHRGPPSAFNAEVPRELDQLVLRASDLDAAVRFTSATELRRALEKVQEQLAPCDVGAKIQELFGTQLASDEQEIERLMAEARRRSRSALPAFLRPLAAPLRLLRRHIVYSRPYQRLARHPKALRAAGAALALLLLGAAAAIGTVVQARLAFAHHLERADAQIVAGRLVGGDGERALDHLVAAKAIRPRDKGVRQRLYLLGEKLEELGTAAVRRGDFAEAVAHLEAALRAEPDRQHAAKLLAEVIDKVKGKRGTGRRGAGERLGRKGQGS